MDKLKERQTDIERNKPPQSDSQHRCWRRVHLCSAWRVTAASAVTRAPRYVILLALESLSVRLIAPSLNPFSGLLFWKVSVIRYSIQCNTHAYRYTRLSFPPGTHTHTHTPTNQTQLSFVPNTESMPPSVLPHTYPFPFLFLVHPSLTSIITTTTSITILHQPSLSLQQPLFSQSPHFPKSNLTP